MVTAVKARPNHYEVLGLERGASLDEIARAFASRMSLAAKSVGTTAQICTAYETLRDPERRRAYDEALDPRPEAAPWAIGQQWGGGPYMMSAAASPAPTRPAPPQPRPEPPAPFIAAPVREPEGMRSAPSRAHELLQRLEQQRRPEPEPEAKPRPTPKADAKLEQLVAEVRALGRVDRERLRTVEPPSFEWRRPALALGGLVLGVGVLGAAAGLSVAGHEQAVQAGAAVSVPLPQATPAAAVDPQPSDLAAVDHAQPAPAAVAARRRDPAARRSIAGQLKPEAAPTAELAASPSPATAVAAEAPAVAAAMPLPAAVVSRTIERIGYPCGGVASSAPVEGSAGVFTVTCASGHTYRAAPVHGRYRFRRVAG